MGATRGSIHPGPFPWSSAPFLVNKYVLQSGEGELWFLLRGCVNKVPIVWRYPIPYSPLVVASSLNN